MNAIVLMAVAALGLGGTRPAPAPLLMRGIWAECEGVNATFSSRAKIEEMFARLQSAGVNTVFMQVYRGDRAWYRSAIADAAPYREFYAAEHICPLRLAIDHAHARGMKLHAWVNVYRVWGGRDAGTIRALGRDAITRDRRGRSMLDCPKESLPDSGYWLDPGDPAVRARLLRIVEEILDRYPDIDGIHLDYVRYPFDEKGRTDFGYGRRSVATFQKKYGFDPAAAPLLKKHLWDEWRRAQVTAFVVDAAAAAHRRGKKLSVATVADEARCVRTTFQDWPRWVGEGIADFVVPMNYSEQRTLVRKRAQAALRAAGRPDRVAIGLGAYKMLNTPAELVSQIQECRALGAMGVVLFSYDNMTRAPGLFSLVGRKAFCGT
ncbi:MAG: family 10 glycosylhydrolase [Candidatus Aureabacteria bacterium]|nr:family 10 glycosylhydrolase [Candidatus Auribacterota bacterium]